MNLTPEEQEGLQAVLDEAAQRYYEALEAQHILELEKQAERARMVNEGGSDDE